MITKELVMEKTRQNQEAAQECSNEQKNQESIGQINKDMKTVKSLQDKLQKEERNTAANSLKLDRGWKLILSQTQEPELHHDIMVLRQTFERDLDGLDNTIKNLERDRQEAECQASSVQRIHLQHIECLQAQQDKRLMRLQQQWENCLQDISSSLNSERKQMLMNSEQLRADVEDIRLAMEQQHNEEMEEIDRVYQQSISSYENADNMRELVTEETSQNQEAVQECSNEQKNQEYIGQINKDMKTLKSLQKDQDCIGQIKKDIKTVKLLQDAVFRLRMNSSKTENQSVVQDLTDAKNLMKQKTHKLRDQLTQAQTAARKQLTDLTVQSDNAAKKLRTVIAKGERVLRVAEMCHKLESKQKDISALFSTEEHSPERTVPDMEEPAKEASGEFPELRQVTQSINTAILRREALKKRRDDLSQENHQLRLQLSQHLDAMKVSDDTFDGCHALLAVHQAPTATGQPGTNRRHVVKRSPKD